MKKILPVILTLCLIPTIVYAKDYVNATDIQKINLGDTFDQVSQKIGEPQQVLTKELTDDSKEKVVWLYEVVKPPIADSSFLIFRSSGQAARANLLKQQVYQQERTNNPPYLVIFINGKVASIKRQQLKATPTAQINVSNY